MNAPLQDLAWSAERFFWAVLEAPGVRAGVLPSALLMQLQDEVPAQVDTLHAVCLPCGDGKILVCAAERTALEPLRGTALCLTPQSIPDLHDAEASGVIDPSALNLLVGPFEPLPLCRERSRRGVILAASVMLMAGVLSLGFARHAQAWDKAGEDARAATSVLLTKHTGAGTVLNLKAEVDRLRASPKETKAVTPQDAAVALAALLAGWPKEIECQTDAVSVSAATITVSFSVVGDARPLLGAIKTPHGWSLDEPRLTTSGQNTRVHLALRRVGGRS